jgi:hypothetical protein
MHDTPPAGCHNPPPRCAVCGGPFPDGSGCEYCPNVGPPPLPEPQPLLRCCQGCGRPWDDHTEAERFACVAWNTRAGRELEPEDLHGDVDINGDLVDLLLVRLRNAVGPDLADDISAAGQVRLSLWLLEASGHDAP